MWIVAPDPAWPQGLVERDPSSGRFTKYPDRLVPSVVRGKKKAVMTRFFLPAATSQDPLLQGGVLGDDVVVCTCRWPCAWYVDVTGFVCYSWLYRRVKDVGRDSWVLFVFQIRSVEISRIINETLHVFQGGRTPPPECSQGAALAQSF